VYDYCRVLFSALPAVVIRITTKFHETDTSALTKPYIVQPFDNTNKQPIRNIRIKSHQGTCSAVSPCCIPSTPASSPGIVGGGEWWAAEGLTERVL
jgi:hypothetical protein